MAIFNCNLSSRTSNSAFRGIAACFLLIITPFAWADGWPDDHRMTAPEARAMLNRFGYGATPASLLAATMQTPRQFVTRGLLAQSLLPESIADDLNALPIAEPLAATWARMGPGGTARQENDDKQTLRQEENRFASAAVQARLLTMVNSENPAHEVLLSFWLNHFSIHALKNLDKILAWNYIHALEQAMSEDSFEALLRASFFHPAMQIYLDNAQSTAPDSPAARFATRSGKTAGINENLARELLELHTLGVDAAYTQNDVQELARIITGAGLYSKRMNDAALTLVGAVRYGEFLFDPRRHDFGAKQFLGNPFPAGQGLPEIDRALHLLALHPATAHRIARKLAQRFLADDPPQAVIEAMAAAYRQSGGRISATLSPLLSSLEFPTSLAQPRKFKEPMDFVLSAARAVCGDQAIAQRQTLAVTLLDMGQAPLMHTTPDGYGSAEADWLSPAAMAKRVRFSLAAAQERLPLASRPTNEPGRLRGLEKGRADPTGNSCRPDEGIVRQAIGPISPTTEASLAGLTPRERIAALLASPEFMRR